jgi:hypothetical protein
MLKAVRFDEVQHKDLLDFVSNYRDNKGRVNESEAIRLLMQKGIKAMNAPQAIETEIPVKDNSVDMATLKQEVLQELTQLFPQNNTQSDIEKIRQEIYTQVMSEVNEKTLRGFDLLLDKVTNLQPVTVQQPTMSDNTIDSQPVGLSKPIPVKKIEVPANATGLLGNLLANSNR